MYAMAHKHQCDYKDIESFFIDTTISQKVTLRCNKVVGDRNCQKIRFSLYSFLLRSLSYEFKYSDTISDSFASVLPVCFQSGYLFTLTYNHCSLLLDIA